MIVRPSVMASTLASWPSSRSSITICLPASPNSSRAERCGRRRRAASRARRADDHAFARGQAVGLDHDRHVTRDSDHDERAGHDRRRETPDSRRSARRRAAAGSCRRPCCLPTAPRPCVGPKTRSLLLLKGIDDAQRQRRFGADDGQADLVLLGELDQAARNRRPRCRRSRRPLAVPALPGATNTRSRGGLCSSFQASACSRPPLPMIRTFICCCILRG